MGQNGKRCQRRRHSVAKRGHVSWTDPKGIRSNSSPITCRAHQLLLASAGMQVLCATVARPAACRPLAAQGGRRLVSAIGRRAIAIRAQTGSGGLTEEGRRAATRDAADRFRADQL